MYREPYSEIRWKFYREAVWSPATDVFETGDTVVVLVDIAGLKEGDYEVTLSGRTLAIGGERRYPEGKRAYQQMEIRYGRFRTDVYLPWALESTGIEVEYQDGFLEVTLNKALARKIPVRVVQENE